MPDFETDPYLGRPKILFVGAGASTHTHAWIDLLSTSMFNVRLFALPDGGFPPTTWTTKTYLPHEFYILPEGLDPSTRKTFSRLSKTAQRLRKLLGSRPYTLLSKLLKRISRIFSLVRSDYDPLSGPQISFQRKCLQKTINEWQPDIVHILGLEPSGEFFYRAYKEFPFVKTKWVLQLRGGSDLVFNRVIPEAVARIQPILHHCDQILTDNTHNIQYLRDLNVSDAQISPLTPVPGTGGVDVNQLAAIRNIKATQSREIVFPKGYELPWSKCLPVFEALQLCWNDILPCKVHILNVSQEIQAWFYTLPEYIRQNCILYNRIARQDFFTLLGNARVLLIPSLVDGVPNTLYEAMAIGVLPIVSPLETIRSVVENERNVLFARNLYPEEIARMLTLAMTNDALVEKIVENNFELVRRIADRATIRKNVLQFYEDLARKTAF
jgi:hypothetical protein